MRLKIHKILLFTLVLVLLLPVMMTCLANEVEKTRGQLIYVIPVQEVVEKGLLAFLTRSFAEAHENRAVHIILDINTPGGAVDAASDIGQLLQSSMIPVTAFVNTNATSAGAFIALNADQIVISPRGSIGSATVVDLEGNAGDAKAMAFWISKMRGAAQDNDRDPLYAEAMVDPEIEIAGLTPKGRPLNFDSKQALEYGYAEAIAKDLDEVLTFIGLEGAHVVRMELSAAEQVARFITHPVVVSILFSLASLGLILELYSPGFGLPGMVGIISLLLFFFGHMVAGFAGWESLLLFAVGVVFIVIELFIPGFGIFGILGIASVLASLTLASVDVLTGLKALAIAVVVSIIALFILGKSLNRRGFWSKLVLQEEVSSEEGKQAFEKKTELVGQIGITLTKLRPAGAASIQGVRYDVVSDGSMIEKDQRIRVISVEGTRIVVRKEDT